MITVFSFFSLPGIPYSWCNHWGCSADERGCGWYHGYLKWSCKWSRHGWRYGGLDSRGNEQGEYRNPDPLFVLPLTASQHCRDLEDLLLLDSSDGWWLTCYDRKPQDSLILQMWNQMDVWGLVLTLTTCTVPVSRIYVTCFYSVMCWHSSAVLGQLASYFCFFFLLIFHVSLLNDQQGNSEANCFQRVHSVLSIFCIFVTWATVLSELHRTPWCTFCTCIFWDRGDYKYEYIIQLHH